MFTQLTYNNFPKSPDLKVNNANMQHVPAKGELYSVRVIRAYFPYHLELNLKCSSPQQRFLELIHFHEQLTFTSVLILLILSTIWGFHFLIIVALNVHLGVIVLAKSFVSKPFIWYRSRRFQIRGCSNQKTRTKKNYLKLRRYWVEYNAYGSLYRPTWKNESNENFNHAQFYGINDTSADNL